MKKLVLFFMVLLLGGIMKDIADVKNENYEPYVVVDTVFEEEYQSPRVHELNRKELDELGLPEWIEGRV